MIGLYAYQLRGLCMEPEHQEYKGHRIELSQRAPIAFGLSPSEVEHEAEPELLIDGAKIDYGKLPDGTYFLHEYTDEGSDNLIDLARKFIDYRIETNEIRQQPLQKD